MAFSSIVGAIQKIVGGVAGTAQTVMGFKDLKRAKEGREEAASFWEDNKYAIPESAKASLSSAERQASGVRMPAEDMYRNRLGETTSAGVGASERYATSGSDVLQTLGSLYGNQMRGEQDIMMEGANRYDRNQSMLRQQLGQMAGYEEEKWRFNSLLPYQQMLAQAEQYATRGAQYISSGVGAMSGVAAAQIGQNGAQGRADQQQQWLGSGKAQAQMQSQQGYVQSNSQYQQPQQLETDKLLNR